MTEQPATCVRSSGARLLAIVSVDQSRRVQCQQPGCGHEVYAAIHVVEEDGTLLVLGSTCFAKRYGSAQALGAPSYSAGGGNGVRLTDAERQVLVENTAALMAQFKERHDGVMGRMTAKLRSLKERAAQQQSVRPALFHPHPAPPRDLPAQHPWPWQHRHNTSVAVIRGPDGQCWVRVQHADGTQKIAPWPVFEGWDEAFPTALGKPDPSLQAYAVPNIVDALAWLRARGFSAPTVSRWPEVLKVAPDAPQVNMTGRLR